MHSTSLGHLSHFGLHKTVKKRSAISSSRPLRRNVSRRLTNMSFNLQRANRPNVLRQASISSRFISRLRFGGRWFVYDRARGVTLAHYQCLICTCWFCFRCADRVFACGYRRKLLVLLQRIINTWSDFELKAEIWEWDGFQKNIKTKLFWVFSE